MGFVNPNYFSLHYRNGLKHPLHHLIPAGGIFVQPPHAFVQPPHGFLCRQTVSLHQHDHIGRVPGKVYKVSYALFHTFIPPVP